MIDPCGPDADTAPLELRAGERVAIEKRIDRVELRIEEREKAMQIARDNFYGTRMVPLEAGATRATGRALIALTLSIVAVGLVAIVHVLVVLLQTVLNLLHVSAYWQYICTGLLTLAAVAAFSWRGRNVGSVG